MRDASDTAKLDLSPFDIEDVFAGKGYLIAKRKLALQPLFDEASNLMSLENSKLGICVYAQSRNELHEELYWQVLMLWEEYALVPDENLTPSAKALKAELLLYFEGR